MTACERCWADSGGEPERYEELIRDRRGDQMCTAEQQAGPDATECPSGCGKTVHQYARRCTLCGREVAP